MKLKELRKILNEDFKDENLEVAFEFPSGDYWDTPLSRDVELVNIGKVLYSADHRENKVLDPKSDGYREHGKTVILLRGN